MKRTRYLAFALVTVIASALSMPAWAMSKVEENRLGRQVMAEARPLLLTEDASLDAIGARLSKVVTRKDVPWRFYVVEGMKEYNAFSAPGGFVFISRPYYAKLNADEAAFVVGHEMGHIDLNHIEKEMKRNQRANIGNLLLRILTNSYAIGAVADIGATAYVTHYSRVLEREADFAGYHYAEKAGYNAQAAVTALSKLGKEPSLHPWVASIYATHPVLSSREDQLAALGGKEPDIKDVPPPDPAHGLNAGLQLDPPVPVAVRILAPTGGRWEGNWRKSFTKLLHLRLTPFGFTIAGDDLMYKSDIGDPVQAARSRQARYLLLVTVNRMESATRDKAVPDGTPVEAKLDLAARLIDVTNGAQVWQGQFQDTAKGTDVLPGDPDTLYPDTTIGALAWKAAGQFALASAKVAGAGPAKPDTDKSPEKRPPTAR